MAASCVVLGISRASYYRSLAKSAPAPGSPEAETATDENEGPAPGTTSSPIALSPEERQEILDQLHSERFIDRAPAEVYNTLLDEGVYLGSVRTYYRILAANHEVKERRAQRRHTVYSKPELLATGPNQVWTWDITKLLGPVKWTYYYLYVLSLIHI